MSNKMLLKQGVLTAGQSEGRVVLCYESGLIYQYSNPENIVGMYQSGKGWIVLQKPYYSRGGWGSGSTGDYLGHALIENAESLVDSIQGRRFRLNSKQFLTTKEINTINAEINKNNALIKKQNEIARRLNRRESEIDLVPLESIRLELHQTGKSLKGIDAISIGQQYNTAVDVFINQKGKKRKIDEYSISKDQIKQNNVVVAFRDKNNTVFMNSQVLNTTHFENRFMGSQSLIQKAVREVAKYSVPFNVLQAANLKLSETKILEQGPESEHLIKPERYSSKTIMRHFTGALLLENAGRKFLMDIDREEIKHQIFNAFFVEVDSKVTTIDEAYESMKPQAVRDAEANGLKVARQGEWFFIETDKTIKVRSEHVFESTRAYENDTDDDGNSISVPISKYVLKHQVAHGKGRPNTLYRPMGYGPLDILVCGTVSHSGREHRDLDLGQDEVTSSGNGDYTTFKLWQLVPNSTVSNFTIEGDVD